MKQKKKLIVIYDEYILQERLTQKEQQEFFLGDWESVKEWIEGEGRSTSNYEILKSANIYILSSQYYGFEEFKEPIYNFLGLNKKKEGTL